MPPAEQQKFDSKPRKCSFSNAIKHKPITEVVQKKHVIQPSTTHLVSNEPQKNTSNSFESVQDTLQSNTKPKKGIRIVDTTQPKDSFRTCIPVRNVTAEEPMFQNKRHIDLDQEQSRDKIFGHYYLKTEPSSTIQTKRPSLTASSLIAAELANSNAKKALNLFADDHHPPVYSTSTGSKGVGSSSTGYKQQHFTKQIQKQNEFKMYDYGSSVNLPNQQVVRVTEADESQKPRKEMCNSAMIRRYHQDVTSSINCLPGVFYKSPQQFKELPIKHGVVIKTQQISSPEVEKLKNYNSTNSLNSSESQPHNKLVVVVKTNPKNEQSVDVEPKMSKIVSQPHLKGQIQLKDFSSKVDTNPFTTPSQIYRTKVNEGSYASNQRSDFYKSHFVLG